MRVRRDLGAIGTPIGGNDTMIARQALAADCVLVTNNTREFSRVAKLSVEDWAASSPCPCHALMAIDRRD
jgi:tRNA(fMet)-specific endonuclease VapC